jgi:hypothetical protein
MKLAKSLLLGSAAALAATAGAQAADLPFRKAAPVEYVRVCDWTGAGFFYIPGTDTCLKIGGFVRAEFEYDSGGRAYLPPGTFATSSGANAGGNAEGGVDSGLRGTYISGRNRDATGFFVRGRLTADARTQTAYGTLRSFIQLQADRTSGAEYTNAAGISITQQPQGGASSTYIDKAFIQFAGITAGRVQSFFDFGADPYGFDGVQTSDSSSQVFAYTATFGGGFSATISAEDPNVRRFGINNSFTANGPTAVAYAGQVIPDVVGVLRLDQAWGAAQLSAAYHEVNTTTAQSFSAITNTGAQRVDDGYAVRGAVQIKLPFLAAGDEFQVEGGYERGAVSYINSNGVSGGYGSPYLIGGLYRPTVDAVAIAGVGGGYGLAMNEGYSVSGGFVHFLTPQFQNIIFGGYDHQEYGRAGNVAWYNGGLGPENSYRIADQFNWFPVKNMQIGIEFMYIKVDQKVPGTPGNAVAGSPVVALPVGIRQNPDGFEARLRMERDF